VFIHQGIRARTPRDYQRSPLKRDHLVPHLRTHRARKLPEQDSQSCWPWHHRADEVQGGFAEVEEGGRERCWCWRILELRLIIAVVSV
jgi:hypothetical protein